MVRSKGNLLETLELSSFRSLPFPLGPQGTWRYGSPGLRAAPGSGDRVIAQADRNGRVRHGSCRGAPVVTAIASRSSSVDREVAGDLQRKLGLWDAVSIIIGIVIGAGIYETAPLVFRNVSSPSAALAVWVLGGLLSLVGACCYAELASTYPRSGGDYVYLSRAFGRLVGFLFGWAQLTVILTGSIGMMAYVFADYAVALVNAPAQSAMPWAAAVVIALTLLHVLSVSIGTRAQNLLTAVKVIGVLSVVAVGGWVALSRDVPPAPPSTSVETGSLGLAMILVLYTFGGWNDAAFVAAEVRERRKNLPRALILGTLAVTLIYLLMNAAFLVALGFEGARSSRAIARDVFMNAFGAWGGAAISLLVMVSALGAASALIFTGSRLHAALGRDYSILHKLGTWHPRLGSPALALTTQLLVTLLLIVAASSGFGQRHGGFDTLLRGTAPVFWAFFLLTGLSLFRLRQLEPQRERPFRVPLYPLTPLVFCGTCVYMLYSSIAYAGTLALLGLVPLLAGLPFYLASKRKPVAAPELLRSAAE
jgi:basic amino acid/polyamine antiporter, APA family